MSSAHHFYLTFNPYLNDEYEGGYTQAHEFYDLLRSEVMKDKDATAFWGKIIAQDRDKNVDFEKFHKILKENQENGLSTHLYITDFKNLWAAKVKNVSETIPKKAKTLAFYEGKKVEVWFEIEDFILTHHNADETASKLSEFYIENEYMDLEIQGLSPFTTSVRYPCVMQDIAEEQYFDEFDKDECSHLVLKDNPAIHKSNIDMVLKVLQTYIFPDDMYSKIPHAAKLEIESAEMDMLENRNHNMQKIAFSYIRALEVVLNDLVVHELKRKGHGESFFVDTTSGPPKLHLEDSKDFYFPLKQYNKNFSLNNLLHFVDRAANSHHVEFKKTFSDHKHFIRFIQKDLTSIIRDNGLIELRNHLAHGEMDKVSTKDAMVIRNIILGVGSPGLIHLCYRYFHKDKFASLSKTSVGQSEKTNPKLKLAS